VIATVRALLDAFGIWRFDWRTVRRRADGWAAQELNQDMDAAGGGLEDDAA
jgi:hypothetical protein